MKGLYVCILLWVSLLSFAEANTDFTGDWPSPIAHPVTIHLYVNASGGLDTNNGHSHLSPFKTFDKALSVSTLLLTNNTGVSVFLEAGNYTQSVKMHLDDKSFILQGYGRGQAAGAVRITSSHPRGKKTDPALFLLFVRQNFVFFLSMKDVTFENVKTSVINFELGTWHDVSPKGLVDIHSVRFHNCSGFQIISTMFAVVNVSAVTVDHMIMPVFNSQSPLSFTNGQLYLKNMTVMNSRTEWGPDNSYPDPYSKALSFYTVQAYITGLNMFNNYFHCAMYLTNSELRASHVNITGLTVPSYPSVFSTISIIKGFTPVNMSSQLETKISQSYFSNIVAEDPKSAQYGYFSNIDSVTVNITDTVFTRMFGIGGMVAVAESGDSTYLPSALVLERNIFSDSILSTGPVTYQSMGRSTIDRCVFRNVTGTAASVGYGGFTVGSTGDEPRALVVKNSQFIDLAGEFAGAIALSPPNLFRVINLYVYNCTFTTKTILHYHGVLASFLWIDYGTAPKSFNIEFEKCSFVAAVPFQQHNVMVMIQSYQDVEPEFFPVFTNCYFAYATQYLPHLDTSAIRITERGAARFINCTFAALAPTPFSYRVPTLPLVDFEDYALGDLQNCTFESQNSDTNTEPGIDLLASRGRANVTASNMTCQGFGAVTCVGVQEGGYVLLIDSELIGLNGSSAVTTGSPSVVKTSFGGRIDVYNSIFRGDWLGSVVELEGRPSTVQSLKRPISFTDCSFTHLNLPDSRLAETPLAITGRADVVLDLLLTRCRFQGNDRLQVRGQGQLNITLVDCIFTNNKPVTGHGHVAIAVSLVQNSQAHFDGTSMCQHPRVTGLGCQLPQRGPNMNISGSLFAQDGAISESCTSLAGYQTLTNVARLVVHPDERPAYRLLYVCKDAGNRYIMTIPKDVAAVNLTLICDETDWTKCGSAQYSPQPSMTLTQVVSGRNASASPGAVTWSASEPAGQSDSYRNVIQISIDHRTPGFSQMPTEYLLTVTGIADYQAKLFVSTRRVDIDLSLGKFQLDTSFLGWNYVLSTQRPELEISLYDELNRPFSLEQESGNGVPGDNSNSGTGGGGGNDETSAPATLPLILLDIGRDAKTQEGIVPYSIVKSTPIVLIYRLPRLGAGGATVKFRVSTPNVSIPLPSPTRMAGARGELVATFRVLWTGWLWIIGAITIAIITSACVFGCVLPLYKRVQKWVAQHTAMRREIEMKDRLLHEYHHSSVSDLHKSFLSEFELTSQPAVVYVGVSDCLEVLCECPGRWHRVTSIDDPADGQHGRYPIDPSSVHMIAAYLRRVRNTLLDTERLRSSEGSLKDDDDTRKLLGGGDDDDDRGHQRHGGKKSAGMQLAWSALIDNEESVSRGSRHSTYSAPTLDSLSSPFTLGGRDGEHDGDMHPGRGSRPVPPEVSKLQQLLAYLEPGNRWYSLQRVILDRSTGLTGWVCRKHIEMYQLQPALPFELPFGLTTRMQTDSVSLDRGALHTIEIDTINNSYDPSSPEHEVITFVDSLLNAHDSVKRKITKITVFQNPMIEQAFRARYYILGQPGRHELRRAWPATDTLARQAVLRVLRQHSDRYRPPDGQNSGQAQLDCLWHGADQSAIENIGRLGFLNLASRNTGWHGRGAYFTHHPLYGEYYATHGFNEEVIASDNDKCLLLCWALLGQVFPVTRRLDRATDAEHQYHGGYPGHDSHVAVVEPPGTTVHDERIILDGKKPRCKDDTKAVRQRVEGIASRVYGMTDDKECPLFDEVVVWQENQLLPRFAVYYQ